MHAHFMMNAVMEIHCNEMHFECDQKADCLKLQWVRDCWKASCTYTKIHHYNGTRQIIVKSNRALRPCTHQHLHRQKIIMHTYNASNLSTYIYTHLLHMHPVQPWFSCSIQSTILITTKIIRLEICYI